MASVEDQIVPVRLDIEHDQWKVKDTFMWNCADTLVSPEMFAQSLCHDFSVPEGLFVPRICAAIRQRVREFQDQVMPILIRSPDATTGKGKIDPAGDDDAQAMFEVFRKAREGSPGSSEQGSSRDREREQVDGSRSSVEIKTESGGDENDTVKIVGEDEAVDVDDDVTMVEVDDVEAKAVKREERPMTVEEATANLSSKQSDDLRFLVKVRSS